ncbi:MAG TPA: PBP1A family penicillin-binding protein [Candidatus Binataceae bacterium]|nr:PBP1A family penicillin-binding protein [Candidatus Binataceae bacterium]
MAETGKGNGKKRAGRSAPKKSGWTARLAAIARRIGSLIKQAGWRRITITAALAAAFGGGFYLAQVYREISVLIEERRAALSSAIYSAPLEIAAGDELAQLHLIDRLNELSYSRVATPTHAGEYSVDPGVITLYQREFTIGATDFPPLLVHLSIDNGRITGVANAFGVALDHADLEPEVIGRLTPDAPAERVAVTLNEVPPFLIKGLLATEDRFFYYHPGFDPIRIIEAAIVDLHSHRLSQGASTLTQQLARTFIDKHTRTFHRKIRELAIAIVLEIRLTKNEILERYINDVPMGEYDGTPIYGMPLAARYFFNKDLSRVTPAEAATLIGMIQAPTLYDPRRHPEACRVRRDTVLTLMQRSGVISASEYQAAMAAAVATVKQPGLRRAPYFTDYVIAQVHKIPGTAEAHGLKVYTTLDPGMQEAAQHAVVDNLERLERQHPGLRRINPGHRLESAMVAIDPRSGAILAMVGGRDYAASQFNRATDAERQPGSAFKPIVYINALDPERNPLPEPVTLASLLPDRPMTFNGWTPVNYERTYQGTVTVAEALAESLNVPTAYLGSLLGPPRIIRTAHALGISEKLPDYLPVTIGAGDVTLMELTGVYSVFASGGVVRPPYTITAVVNGNGHVLLEHRSDAVRLMSRAVAYLMTGALQGVFQYGTAASAVRLGLDFPAAGKTGTTDDYRDAWFLGYTRHLVCGVWVGFDEPNSIGLTGAAAALPAWVDFMKASELHPDAGFGPPPAGVTMVTIDPASGGIATSACPRVQRLPFLDGTEPTQICPLHGGASMASAASSPPSGAPADSEAGDGSVTPPSTAPPPPATNSMFGAIGHFFGSIFH